jgi:hypothetical protein
MKRELTKKEENLIDDLWTTVEPGDSCDGAGGGSERKSENCPSVMFDYDPRYGTEFYQCLKMVIEQIHEDICT